MSGKTHKQIRKQNKALRRDENKIASEARSVFLLNTLASPFHIRFRIALRILKGLPKTKGMQKNGKRKP